MAGAGDHRGDGEREMKGSYLRYDFKKTDAGLELTTDMHVSGMDAMMAVALLIRDLYEKTPEPLRDGMRAMFTTLVTAPDSPAFDLSRRGSSGSGIRIDMAELRRQMEEAGDD